jgi:hypothetical protein
MGPSVRVKRRHAYASIQDEGRRPEHPHDDQQAATRQALSETSGAMSSTPATTSQPPTVPHHDPTHLSPNASTRREMSRVNRHTRRNSVSYRSFGTDLESNPSESPQVAYGRSDTAQLRETLLEGASANAAAPHTHRVHSQRVSRVRSALSSSPSSRDSDDSDSDSEDEDRILEDDEYHHDDGVVDHLDVIGSQSIFCPFFKDSS